MRNVWAVLGLVILVLGVVALFVQGITYVRQEEVLDLGPLEVVAEREEVIPVPGWVGIVGILVGAILLVVGLRAARGR